MAQGQSSRGRFASYLAARRSGTPANDGSSRSPGEAKPLGRSLGRLYVDLWKMMRGHRLAVASALAASSVATLLKLVPPAATKWVIDYVLSDHPLPSRLPGWAYAAIPPSPRARLFGLVGVVLVVSVVGTLVGLWSRWRATKATKRVQAEMRRKVFEHASRLPLHRVYKLKAGGASSLLREDAGGLGELIFSMLYNPWRAVVQFAGGLVVLSFIDARFLIGALFLAPLVYYSDRLWNKRLRPLYRDVRKQRQDIDAKAVESFGGMRVVRAFGRQRREGVRFVGENHYMTRQEVYAWWASRGVEILWDLLLPAASGALLLYGGLRVLNHQMTLGDMMMFLVYLAMLLEPVAVIASSVTQLQANLSGFDRVLDLLAEPREMADNPGSRKIDKADVIGRLTLQNVGFRYPEGDKDVLNGIDLEVQPGETIALVGRSGAGKTTLCNLVARFYDPTSGSVKLDGLDLREIDVESYRRLLGIVEQDVFLFDGTIAANIAYADRHASREAVIRAAQVAYADEFIDAMPEGYDTVIGERGVRLSGGQRQRLAIARAVLADPKVFILDEATSNLDSASERQIQRGLSALMRGRTSFVIAHRLSTIRDADRIVVLQDGKVAEVGTHDELMERGGGYREMVLLQSEQPVTAPIED